MRHLLGSAVLLASLAAGAQASDEYFVQFEPGAAGGGIVGESSVKGYEKDIEAYSISWGVSRPAGTTTAAAGGGSTAKPQFSALSFMTSNSAASPSLMLACASGRRLAKVTVHGARPSGTAPRVEFLTLVLEDVYVTGYQVSGSNGEDAPAEALSLSFTKITMTEIGQSANGSPHPVTTSWDITKNAAK